MDLSAQVYPVPDVSVDVPVDPPVAEAVRPGRVTAFGLVPDQYAASFLDGFYWRGVAAASTDSVAGSRSSIPGAADFWSLGARSWRYVSADGYGLTLGNEPARVPSWSRPVRLAGIGVYGTAPDDSRQSGGWNYAVAAGALDDPASTAASGGLAYGPAAYDVSFGYAVDPGLSLASQVQGAPDLLALGLGGEYAMGGWGSWALGVSRAQRSLANGWRYQLGYAVDVFSDLNLSWVNEQRGAGYADLSAYGEDPLACDCGRNQWQLSVPTGSWGQFSGTYEQRVGALAGRQRTVGLAQQFRYGPRLDVHLEANSNIVTGAYGLGARFSLPVD
uniref:hypothetical protein n=1 Tax=Castellaniella defragrans TaxID=75697 RepID=UPI00333F12B9